MPNPPRSNGSDTTHAGPDSVPAPSDCSRAAAPMIGKQGGPAGRDEAGALIARLESNWDSGDDAANDELVAEYCAAARRRQRPGPDARKTCPADEQGPGSSPPDDDGARAGAPGPV